MTAASSALMPWPPMPAWRFARPAAGGLQWVMRRNCSLSPRQAGIAYLGVCLLSLTVAGVLWLMGATLVMPFAWLELLALGAAWLVYARHAADRELLTLRDGALDVEHRCGRTVQQASFRAGSVRIEPTAGDGSLIEISGQGARMRIGRYLRPELRDPLARELRRAVRAPIAPDRIQGL